MANPMKGEAQFTLEDGRTLTLCFDANAWIEIEEVLGMGVKAIQKVFADATEDNPPPMKYTRALIFGGLRKHHPEMTLRDAGEVMVDAAEAMDKAIEGGAPRPEEGGESSENPPKATSRSTGTKPSPVGAA